MRKERNSLYSRIIDLQEEVEQSESVRNYIEQLQENSKELTQVKKNELDL